MRKLLSIVAMSAVGMMLGAAFAQGVVNNAAKVTANQAATKPLAAKPGATKAGTATEASVKAALQERLGADAPPIKSVRLSGYGGLWEVQIGKDIIYTDNQASFLFVGNVLDAKTRENLTQARLDEVTRVDFKSLPLDMAVKSVHGKGERVVAVFADPNCGFCKRFQAELNRVDNITVYTFLYPILAEDSVLKSRQIWCAKDASETWNSWMTKGEALSGAGDCANPIDKVAALGHDLRIDGTPTLFFPDGKRVPGAIPPDQFEALLKQGNAKALAAAPAAN